MTSNTAQYTTYKFRAECPSDVAHIRAVLSPWLLHWKEERSVIHHEGQLHGMADTDVEFSIHDGGPQLDEIRWLVDAIKDCHVAAETVELAGNYTGQRHFEHERQLVSRRPGPEFLRMALSATGQRKELLRLNIDRSRDTLTHIETEMRFPSKGDAKSKNEGEPSPGWLAVVQHKPTGLTAIRRVAAPRRAKNWRAEEAKCMNARFTALQE